ncbi:pentatricopeptide repeat-containing protein, partial [Trifolium medium]|nr:pentatricopeptide repeat-containing protein [Trifolium medium]
MWFYCWCEENPDADWESFSTAMVERFGTQSEHSQEKPLLENQEIELELGKTTEARDEVVFNEALSEMQRSEKERV